jgi:lysophospholipase L1-like esterase
LSAKRWSDIAAVVVAIAVVGGVGYVLRLQGTPAVAGSAATTGVERVQLTRDPGPSVLFIGDSYTAGNGLKELSPSCIAARKMGWLCELSAVPGTGYISGGPANRFTVDPYVGESTSFVERIPKLAQIYEPDVVVLDGGRNDLFPPQADVFKAMVATIGEARRAWPTATLVLVRPRFLKKPEDDLGFGDAFIARLMTQPGVAGTVVIDPISWFTGQSTSGMLSGDGTHPNQRGEQELADALVDSLLGHGFAVRN